MPASAACCFAAERCVDAAPDVPLGDVPSDSEVEGEGEEEGDDEAGELMPDDFSGAHNR